ncbi:uncharacterized protein Tco025E_01869 [Trypanosoma conorhini]|uniref:Uncharacterized protein n=1 Tax=Trypanosoma conorhini TaxID=83891 RepID=A0A422Q7D8_9TRYP|nr:uncharacterized protein Tco025E_01869 [Trypanosoma conorhini]RNF25864.1 hypothetical protein Tco025E_01869 [Trypanosoma conorhini]
MRSPASPTAGATAAEGGAPLPSSPAAATGDSPTEDTAVLPQKEGQQPGEEGAARGEAQGPTTPMHSAMKGRSGRERSTDLKPRFNPDVSVIETPSYVLVMNGEEGEEEAEELAVFNRLYEEAKARLERAKAATGSEAEAAESDAKECTFSPDVSSYAKQLGKYANFREFLLSQEEHRKMSAMQFGKKKEKVLSEERLSLFEDMPRKHSLRIIAYLEKERQYKGPIKGWRERFRAYMKRLQEQDRELTPCKSKTHADASSVHSAPLRDDAVFERLYEEAAVRARSQRVVTMTQLEKESRELYCPVTNESEYWASGSQSSGASHRRGRRSSSSSWGSSTQRRSSRSGHTASAHRDPSGSVFDELHAMSEEYRRRRELRALEAMSNREEFTFRPATNPQSSKIIMERAIARARGELPERATRKQGSGETEADSQERRRSSVRFNPDIFCSRLQRKEAERLWRLAALQRSLRLAEASECTFRPSISRTSQAMALQRGYGQITFAPGSPDASPPQPRRHPLGSGEDDDEDDDGVPRRGDGSGTPQRDLLRHRPRPQQEAPPRRSGGNGERARRDATGAKRDDSSGEATVGRVFDVAESEGGYIAALSSEIQGVLSQWSEAAARARATT